MADPAKLESSRQWDNLEVLEALLRPDEAVLVLAEAAQGRFQFGLLAATDRRLIYVRNRIVRRAVMVITPYEEVRSVEIAEEQESGILVVQTAESTLRFDTIIPKERTWLLYWRIQERASV